MMSRDANPDESFRRAVTADAVVSMGFDLSTGKRIVSPLDVLPRGLTEDMRLINVLEYLYTKALHPEEQAKLGGWLGILSNMHKQIRCQQSRDDEFRFCGLTGDESTYRWYRVRHAFVKSDVNRHVYCYLLITDGQDQKREEQRRWELLCKDPATDMLNRIAFEKDHLRWINATKEKCTAPASVLSAVIVSVDSFTRTPEGKPLSSLQEIMQQTAKTIKSFVRSYETCCRYSANEFALTLAAQDVGVLYERIRILKFALSTQSGICQDLPIRIGCNSVLVASQTSFDDLFLKADLALEWANGTDGIYDYSSELHPRYRDVPAPAATERLADGTSEQGLQPAREAQKVYIRTFGHFDLLVNGKAVLFNHRKAKELLALLVDRRGGFMDTGETVAYLWGDEEPMENLLVRGRKAAMYLMRTLEEHNVSYLLETIKGKWRVATDRFECDYYDYLAGNLPKNAEAVAGYLSEYHWSKHTLASMFSVKERHAARK